MAQERYGAAEIPALRFPPGDGLLDVMRLTEKPWGLRLICCGYDNGTAMFKTWDEADACRESYVQAPDHKRSAILIRAAAQEERD